MVGNPSPITLSSHKVTAVVIAFILVVYIAVLLIPLIWAFLISITPPQETLGRVKIGLPENPTFKAYYNIWKRLPIGYFFLNSTIVAITSTIITIIISFFASYAISRLKFPGRRSIFLAILGVYMIPRMFLTIPFFLILHRIHLLDTHLGLILAHLTFSIPFGIWIMKGYFDGLPRDMEEAGLIDGCSLIQVLFKIVVPIAIPGIAVVAVFSFLSSWHEFLFAITLMISPEMKTVPAGAIAFQDFGRWASYSQIMAYAIQALIPVIVFFAFTVRYFVKGLTAGAVKA